MQRNSEKPVITVEPKGEKKDSKKIKKKNGYYITNLALASEVTAINVDQLDIVPSIAEETDEKPVITVEPKISRTLFHNPRNSEKPFKDEPKEEVKKRTKSRKPRKLKRYSAKEAASSQDRTDITSRKLALASEVTAINVDQLDIAPSIPEETDEKTSDNDIPKAAKEGATSQVTETDITSPKFTLASEDTAVDVDQQNIVPTIPEETVEKPLLRMNRKVKKDSKKIKKKSRSGRIKETKKTEKDIAAKEAASSQDRNGYYITETGLAKTDITSRKLALASEVTAINVDQLDIVPSIAKETDEKPVITKTKRTEKDIAAKEAASSQVTETDITSPNLALASEVYSDKCRSAGHCSINT
ncbi:Protein SCAF11 [Trichinella spiralis]|uniref:Protein SCAF11 n=1 Tax=Trichinella spiralis TaxID=6334 RepID=A0ABR3KG78_TRISP